MLVEERGLSFGSLGKGLGILPLSGKLHHVKSKGSWTLRLTGAAGKPSLTLAELAGGRTA